MVAGRVQVLNKFKCCARRIERNSYTEKRYPIHRTREHHVSLHFLFFFRSPCVSAARGGTSESTKNGIEHDKPKWRHDHRCHEWRCMGFPDAGRHSLDSMNFPNLTNTSHLPIDRLRTLGALFARNSCSPFHVDAFSKFLEQLNHIAHRTQWAFLLFA